jgi:hypothetical protein
MEDARRVQEEGSGNIRPSHDGPDRRTNMKCITSTAVALVMALSVCWPAPARAQDFNPLEKTYLTFSNSVELPGMTLPSGTYTFKLADTPGRNVVQVMSRDEKTIHGQFLFVQAQRRDATSDTVVMFHETAEGATPAVQYWFYPGESIGKEFVYPKDQALKIAARTHTPVLSSDGDRLSTIDERGNATPFEPRSGQPADSVQARAEAPAQTPPPVAPPAPSSAVTQPPSNVGQPTPPQTPVVPPAQEPRQDTVAETLPQTASPLPLLALLGVMAVGASIGLRLFRA